MESRSIVARWPKGAFIAIALGLVAMLGLQLAGRPSQQGELLWNTSDNPAAVKWRAFADEPLAPKFAPERHDVTIILFSDYQCAYCRTLHRDLERLLQNDGNIRVVYRDWPIFGAASQEAARAAIASQFQGKHAAYNRALMRAQGAMGNALLRQTAAKSGLDWGRLQRDRTANGDAINQVLSRTSVEAVQLGLRGTPGLIIGPYLFRGAIGYDALEDAVERARDFQDR